MHPALSVIVFTVSSGIGYGMLFWLAMNAAMGEGPGLDFIPWPARSGFGIAAFGFAFATIVVGLLSSTLHLGHPERAWRALSQWRSSWLSREGVMAIVTFVPTGLFAIGCVFFERADGWWLVAGIAGAVIPIALTRLGQDPAQSSTIVLTTITDVAGFMSFLGIAALLSGLL